MNMSTVVKEWYKLISQKRRKLGVDRNTWIVFSVIINNFYLGTYLARWQETPLVYSKKLKVNKKINLSAS